VDVFEWITVDDDQICQLAHFHRTKVSANATQGCGVPGRCQESLPRRGAIFDPQAYFQQCRLFQGPDVRPQGHLHATGESALEPMAVLVHCGIGALTEIGR
jgi:hypothetical protein